MKIIFTFLLALSSYLSVVAQRSNYVVIDETDSEREIIKKAANVVPSKRQLKWQELELTGFLHVGVNTFTGREWGTGNEDPRIFNPSQLDARQWVRVCRDAGIKQVIITAKHHDGFCLWPTKTTEHSVKNSPWKDGNGDVVRDVSEAAKQYGLGFGIYLSPWDMNSPLYGTDAYNDFFVKQLTELLTRYGRVDEVWFDGANGEGANGKRQVYDFSRWYALIRKLQPSATIAIMGPDVRWVGTETGYGREMEWSVVPTDNLDPAAVAENSQKGLAFKPDGDMRGDDLGSREKILKAKGLVWYPAETDVSIRPGWFYHAEEDEKVKTPEKLLDIYFNSVGRNGVLLLNIPPDKRGLIHENDVKSLTAWKTLREQIFDDNLMKGAQVSVDNGKRRKSLIDGRFKTNLTTKEQDSTVTIHVNLNSAKTFDVLLLQENIAKGQRVEKFSLEALIDGEWKKITGGTTIGYKRLLRFDPVRATQVRLKIEASRLNPFISEMGLYKMTF